MKLSGKKPWELVAGVPQVSLKRAKETLCEADIKPRQRFIGGSGPEVPKPIPVVSQLSRWSFSRCSTVTQVCLGEGLSRRAMAQGRERLG